MTSFTITGDVNAPTVFDRTFYVTRHSLMRSQNVTLSGKIVENSLAQISATVLESNYSGFTIASEVSVRGKAGANLGGGCWGCAAPPHEITRRLSNTTGILQKKEKNMCTSS